MPDADHLRRLALAAMRGAEDAHGALVANALQASPEFRADPAIIRILDDPAELAVLDQPPALAAELKLVARVVDRPRAVGFHHDAALDAGDHFIERRVARLEIEVGHAIDRRTVPAVGAGVRRSRKARALLRRRAAERSLEDAVA